MEGSGRRIGIGGSATSPRHGANIGSAHGCLAMAGLDMTSDWTEQSLDAGLDNFWRMNDLWMDDFG